MGPLIRQNLEKVSEPNLHARNAVSKTLILVKVREEFVSSVNKKY